MKTQALCLFLSLALCASRAFAAAHTEVTTAPRLPFLRGMGFSGFYGYGNDQYARQASVLATLKAKGFDHIRLPVDFRLYSTYDSGTGVATLLDQTYVRPTETWAPRFYAGFSDFDSIIDNAEAAGLYITLDFHGWFDISTTNANDRAQFKALWRAVAERYQNRSNKLVFELANEPGVNNGTTVNALNTLQKETVSIIRETNPTRLILYAVADANQPWALTLASNPPNYGWVSYPANDNNLALVIHSYNPGAFTHQGETWANPSYTNQVRFTNSHRSTLNWDLNQISLYLRDHDIPIVLNEFNVSHKVADHGDITEYLSIVTRYCEANGIPWSPWIYYADGGGMDCFKNTTEMYDFSEAGLFPDLVVTDKFATNMYAKSIDITFSGYSGSSALANFPALVKLSESGIHGFRYADFQKPNGFDLAFTDASGNLIPHEIDTWDTNGVSTVWVKVPALTASTTITAHYGCAKPIVPKVESVWDSDYVGVWHMGEQKLPLADSSNVSRDVTSADGTGIGYGAAGIVGGSVDFGAASSSRCVNTDDHRELDGFQKFTIEVWTRQDTHAQNSGILSKRNYYGSQVSYYLYDNGSGTVMQLSTNGTDNVSSGVSLYPVLGQWNHQVFTVDTTAAANNVRGYLNGASAGTASKALPGGIFAGSAELHLGNLHSGNAANFPGKIDELRISKCVRSPEWIQATHDTIAYASFATYAVRGVETPAPTDLASLKLKARTDKANPIDYAVGENIRFDFFLDGVDRLPPDAIEPLSVIWTRTGDDGLKVVGTNGISLAQGFSIDTSLAVPGIERIKATLVGPDFSPVRSASVASVAFEGGAGAETQNMRLSGDEPADFDAFWAEAKARLATAPFDDASVELVDVTPAAIAGSFTVYAAKIPCYGPRPVTGWLTIPKNVPEGGLPIQANFDGYGCVSAAPSPPTWGVSGQIRFAVNAHGYDLVGHDDQYYKDFNDSINKTNRTFNGTTYGYALAPQDYDDPTDTYFYYMALRVVRAFDYLKSRPEWNGRDVIAEGGSQGGLQTMWAGGLVDGITKIRPSITWGCDIGCPFNGSSNPYPSRTWGIPCVPGALYFDSALHAKRVPRDCVAEITRVGLGDYTSPPRGVLLSYHNLPCAATAKIVQGSGHGYIPPDPNQQFTLSKAAAPSTSLSLSDAAAAPGFSWTNATATVTATVADASAIPAGAKVRLTVMDASGAVVGTVDHDWTGTGEYAFDTAGAIGGAAFANGYDYTFAFSVVDAGGTALVEDTATAALRLGASAPWFSADAATATVAGGSWATTPSIKNGAYAVGPTTSFTADEGRAGYARIEFTLPGNGAVSASSLPGLLAFAVQNGERASIAAVLGDGGAIAWHGLVQENGVPAWRALEGADASSASGSVAFELDTSAATPRVSYFVWDAGAEPPSFIRLHDANGAEWFDAPGSGATMAGHLDFQGDGAVNGFVGQMLDKAVAEADGVRYGSLAEALATGDVTLLTNAEWPAEAPAGTFSVDPGGHTLLRGGVSVEGGSVVVDSGPVALAGEGTVRVTFANLARLGVATAGLSPSELAAALAEDGANGIPKWQSYVLGLDTTNPDARPLADIALGDAGNTVGVSACGMNINEDAGATVTYQVYEIADLTHPDVDTAVGAPAVPGTSVALPVGSASSAFFRIKVKVTLPAYP